MAIHTAAWSTVNFTGTSPISLGAVADQVLAASGTDGLIPRENLKIVAAYAGGTQLKRARVNAPTLARIAPPWIRPISATLTPASNPPLQQIIENPLPLASGENLRVDAVGSATPADIVALVWLCDQFEPIPHGPIYNLQFTTPGSSGAAAYSWFAQTPTYNEQLPSGRYAVVGFEIQGPSANVPIAARLVFPGGIHRPGTLAVASLTDRTADPFYNGAMGVLGYLDSFALPSVEILQQTATNAAYEGYLRVIQVADGSGKPVNT